MCFDTASRAPFVQHQMPCKQKVLSLCRELGDTALMFSVETQATKFFEASHSWAHMNGWRKKKVSAPLKKIATLLSFKNERWFFLSPACTPMRLLESRPATTQITAIGARITEPVVKQVAFKTRNGAKKYTHSDYRAGHSRNFSARWDSAASKSVNARMCGKM